FGSRYDPDSVMQYGGNFFSKNGRPTLINKASGEAVQYQRHDFSTNDLLQLNRKYECTNYIDQASVSDDSRAAVATRRTRTDIVCRDKSRQLCANWSRLGYCQRNYVNYMRENCPLSCGRCTSETTTTVPTTTTTTTIATTTTQSSCSDKRSSCSSWVTSGYCQGDFATFMRNNCPSSCGHCNNGNDTSICAEWVQAQYCTRIFVSYMQNNCARSCGFCT
uniref:ShKT domain-containing protein n=1 Tax=Ciona savignyi TaxID=51511 RepID=H2YJD4_CIOSA